VGKLKTRKARKARKVENGNPENVSQYCQIMGNVVESGCPK
jgi:hypothetical protein